jgi:hypothetical protein
MNESLRLAAWLSANAKHMRYQQESDHMMKASRQLRMLDSEIYSNIKTLEKAQKILIEMRAMLEEGQKMVADMRNMLKEVSGVPEQEIVREVTGVPVSGLWR